jgi:hypothetical protein
MSQIVPWDPVTIRMQNKGQFKMVGVDLFPVGEHLRLELVENECLLRQTIIAGQRGQPIGDLVNLGGIC